jgi:putative oxidoreductase
MARAMSRLGVLSSVGLLVLRGVVGIVMAFYGWRKLDGGVANFAGFVESLNVPLPELTAYLVTALELGGGILLIAGFLTRLWALLIAIEMVFTTLLVKVDVGLIGEQGAGAELDLLILGGCLVLFAIGPGRLSLDRALGIEGDPVRPAA